MIKFDPTFKARPLSWSQISSFEYDPNQWYDTYVLGNKQTSVAMDFGSMIDKKIQDDPTFLPNLPRYPLMQYKMKVNFDGLLLTGVPDGLDLDNLFLADYKTGKNPWNTKRANETGQLTMYLFLIFITHKIPPEKFRCFIHWLPTQENQDFTIGFVKDMKPITFETRRTMADLLFFGKRIKSTIIEMQEFIHSKGL